MFWSLQVSEPYDWRLAISNMERRDGYFTRIKSRMELLHQLNREKVFVISHSVRDRSWCRNELPCASCILALGFWTTVSRILDTRILGGLL